MPRWRPLAEQMDALQCILGRRSATAIVAPEPTEEQIGLLLQAATAAPDHKLLRPWRFVVVRGDGRRVFGSALALGLAQASPASSVADRERQAAKAMRAPMMIALVAKVADTRRVPKLEQIASTAAAGQNLCLAANAMGLAAAWKSTSLADQPAVRAVLGLEAEDELLGWVDLGYWPEGVAPKERIPFDLAQVTVELTDQGLMPLVLSERVAVRPGSG